MKQKKKWSINRKALTGTIIFTFLLTFLCCVGGSFVFDRAIEKMYNDKGYVLAEIIANEIDLDKVAEYTRTWKADGYYAEMEAYLHFIEDTSNAAFIYIAVPYEDRTMRYVYDTATYIGDSDPIAAQFDEIWKAYTEGVRPQSYLVRNSKKYGFLTSSCLPLKDSSGNVIALLFVDTSMNDILKTIWNYAINMILICTGLLVIFCVSNWYFISRNLINPLMLIRRNVRNFAANNGAIDDCIESIDTGDEMEELADSVIHMERDIVKYIENIQSITSEKERISAELDVASKIQYDMLPGEFPPFPDRKEFDIYAIMDPAKEVGGDFYDFFFIDQDHLALVMADVSGKGIPAALFMAKAKAIIRNSAVTKGDLSPSRILREVNAQLCENNAEDYFVTVWFGIIELSTGRGTAANAGHEYPAIKKAGGEYELLIHKHSPALAISEDLIFAEHAFDMNPGDSFFVYTDGVPEATNPELELYGTKRLLTSLNHEPDATAQKLIENVKGDIDTFVKEADQFDDITMLSFIYHGLGE